MKANPLKDDIIATLSHELRNPLALIQMQAELLMRAKETQHAPRLAAAAGIIHQTVTTQARLIDDMLDVSRMRTGKFAIAASRSGFRCRSRARGSPLPRRGNQCQK